MIPTHIHQIWIGPKQRPNEWLDTWPKKNPSFTFTLWDEQAIDNFGLVNRDKYDRFAVFEYDERVANGVIGTVPYHPILLTYQQRIQSATVIEPPCFTIGGTLLTTCVDRFMWYNRPRHHGAKYSAIKILPSYTFYPKLGHYHEADGLTPPIYARQMWGTTKGIYKDAT
jgi:hypothetical protein